MPTTILDNETYPEALHRRYAEESRIDRKIEIISMAKSAGFFEFNVEGWVKEFERFAALVAAHEKKFWMEQIEVECNEAVLAEREACAKVCESFKAKMDSGIEHIAADIRARGEK